MFLISELVIPARRHRGNWLRFFQDLWEGKPIAWTVVGVIALIIAAVLVIKFRYGGQCNSPSAIRRLAAKGDDDDAATFRRRTPEMSGHEPLASRHSPRDDPSTPSRMRRRSRCRSV